MVYMSLGVVIVRLSATKMDRLHAVFLKQRNVNILAANMATNILQINGPVFLILCGVAEKH